MTSKHYRWQLNWSVDLAACTATHSTGMVVDFAPGNVTAKDAPPFGTLCRGAGGEPHIGSLRGGEQGARAWLATQPALRDPTSQSNRLARLIREAGEIYSEHLNGKAR